jgi:hypothetical protein
VRPRKILKESVRVALVAFGRMLLQEGAVWAARRVERQKVKGRRRRILSNPAIAPLIKEGARLLETRWNDWLSSQSTSRTRPGGRRRHVADDGTEAQRNGAGAAKKARKKK